MHPQSRTLPTSGSSHRPLHSSRYSNAARRVNHYENTPSVGSSRTIPHSRHTIHMQNIQPRVSDRNRVRHSMHSTQKRMFGQTYQSCMHISMCTCLCLMSLLVIPAFVMSAYAVSKVNAPSEVSIVSPNMTTCPDPPSPPAPPPPCTIDCPDPPSPPPTPPPTPPPSPPPTPP